MNTESTESRAGRARAHMSAYWADVSSTPLRRNLSLLFGALIIAGIAWRIYASYDHADFTGNDQRFYSTIAQNLANLRITK